MVTDLSSNCLVDGISGVATPSFGGVSAAEARAIMREYAGISLASRKLYKIEVEGGGKLFQLLTTDITFSPVTIPSERHQIGSASLDSVKTTENVEMRITVFDNKKGEIKRWFDKTSAKVAHSDGTVGLPAEYLVKIRVLHAYFSDETNKGGYENNYLMRPVSSEYEFSREEGGPQKLNLVFTQFDTFF